MRTLLSLFLLILFSAALHAQDSYAITLKGDTIQGDVFIQSTDFYDEVSVKSDDGRLIFKSYQVKLVQIRQDQFRPIAYNNKKVFAKIIQEGPQVSYYMAKPEGQKDYNENLLIKKNGEQLTVGVLGFRKRTSEFFKNCEVITSKLDEKEVGFSDLENLVNLYNEQCGDLSEPAAKIKESTEADFSEMKIAVEVISDVLKKLEKGEPIPSYQLEILKKQVAIDLNAQLAKLIEAAEHAKN